MPRKSKKKVAFLEKPDISGKGRGCLGGPRLRPLLPMLAPPPNQTPHPARAPKQTSHSTLPPKPTLDSTWPPAPPHGRRQLREVNQPVNSSCLTSGADTGELRIPWQHRNESEEKRIPAGAGPAQVRNLILLQRSDSEKAKEEVQELHNKVLYLTGQYEDRVRDMEELLEAVQLEWRDAERERQEVEQQNSELRSFNTELRSLIVCLQTCADSPPRRAPERERFLSRALPAAPHPRALWLRDSLATPGLFLDQLPL